MVAGAGHRQLFPDQSLRGHMHRHEADFVALTLDPKVHHALAALNVPDS
jgi:hypothetical protein